jgi:hypothetical protein
VVSIIIPVSIAAGAGAMAGASDTTSFCIRSHPSLVRRNAFPLKRFTRTSLLERGKYFH